MLENAIYITCHPYLSPYLNQEVSRLGFKVEKEDLKGLLTFGSYDDTLRLNLKLRTANRVLFKIKDFPANNLTDLYRQAFQIEWEKIIPNRGYLSVDSSIRNQAVKDTRLGNLKLKDAIVDRIRSKTGSRPDSGSKMDRSVVFLHWYNKIASVYIDTSGESISKHGYRKFPFKAPMIESLAAATVMATKWDMDTPFINPMCGSGTVAIEAALLALNKDPGLNRKNFGFMHTLLYDPDKWTRLKESSISDGGKSLTTEIYASDVSHEAIRAARRNARIAEVEKLIHFEVCDFRQIKIPSGKGIVFLNPEYGERMGKLAELENVYAEIGDFFKKNCVGKTGFVFTGNLDLAKKIGLRTSAKSIFYNGKIECRLLRYELYSGSRTNK